MKSTKKSLLLSTISLVLCFAMLLGTTWAWFTDEVTSGVNKIVAGNLDIEVEYSKDGTDWANLQDSPSLFTGALWEPGHTEVVYLRVKNAGTLALKYDLKVSPISETGGINQEGNSFKLSDYIKFATVSADTLTTYTRETARTAVGEGVALNSGLLQSGEMLPKAAGANDLPTKYVTLVVYMPEDVGNVANYKTGTTAPEIDLGITVLATQLKSEADSFGNTYDDGLTNDISVVYNYFPQVNVTAQLVINEQNKVDKGSEAGDNVTVTPLTGDNSTKSRVVMSSTEQIENTPAAKLETILEKQGEHQTGSMTLKVVKDDTTNANFKTDSTKINTATQDSTTYQVTVETEGVVAVSEESKAKFKVDLFIGKSRTNVKMYHSGTEMTDAATGEVDTFTYNASTGYVTMCVDSFSPFTAVYDMPVAAIGTTVYYTLQAAIDAAQANDTVVLLKNVAVTAPVEIAGKEITLNLNGMTLSYAGETNKTGVVIVRNGAGLTVTGNGKIVSGENIYAAICMTKTGDNDEAPARLTVENGEIVGKYYAIAGNGSRHNTEIIINGGTLGSAEGLAVFHPQSGTMTINGGTFTGAESAIEMRGGTLNITDGTFTSTAAAFSCNPNGSGSTTVGAAIAIAQHTTKKDIAVNISGGTFTGAKALNESNPQANDPAPQVTMSITGGTFNGEVSLTDVSKCITGGMFSSDPTAYVADGKEAVQVGTNYIVETILYWKDFAADAYAKEENNVIEIATAEQLAKFAKEVNDNLRRFSGITVKLTADINLAGKRWTPIGDHGVNPQKTFAGTFDGQGHKIIGLTIAPGPGVDPGSEGLYVAGLFGFIGEKNGTATVKNLVFEHACVAAQRGGVAIGQAEQGSIIIENIKVSDGTLTIGQKSGGIIGYVRYCDSVSITNCSVDGLTFNGYNYQAGGIIGDVYIYKNSTIEISNNTVKKASIAPAPSDNSANPIIGEFRDKEDAKNDPYTVTVSNNSFSDCTGFPTGANEFYGSIKKISAEGTITSTP